MFEIFCTVIRCAIGLSELVLLFAFSIKSMMLFFDPITLSWIRNAYPAHNSNYHCRKKY